MMSGAAVMWALMWTAVLYVYWFWPALLLQALRVLIVDRADAPPLWLQILLWAR